MSLVLELQRDLISNEVELTTILRKALLISNKLSIKESIQWLEYEMNGYPNNSG
ncbi:AbiTii domain-containing protein, partial [Cetobacterium sp.]|uniref:AbiTii domain-containing protein n=1 Tax=Cetobacterium sp. TaxID=2071632 RepID=UPI003EE63155